MEIVGFIVNAIIVIFALTMLYRLVKAVERIADEIDHGITIKTKEAP